MPQTLLLADDSVTIQRVIELTFADEDIQVVAVGDGDEALARIEAAPPDIVLVDVGMPGRSGYEVAEYIKRSPRLAHIPVLLLTGAFEPVDQEKATRAGCDGVLAKPFEPQFVISRVKELLARPRSDFAPTDTPPPARPAPQALDEWAAPRGSHEPGPAAGQQPPVADDYFDRLDAAFANLSTGRAREGTEASTTAAIAPDVDWFDHRSHAEAGAEVWDIPALPAAEAVDLPLSEPLPPAVVERPSPPSPPPVNPAPLALSQDAVVPPSAPPAGLPVAVGSLADAFAMLLAAEQHQPVPAAGLTWPSAPAAAVDTDALVEQVSRRVLDQLSDRVVRETVADIVSNVAERLVREEIERIKASTT